MNGRTCKKCGNNWISGPHLEGHDRLRFHCACGYSWTEPTLDAKRERDLSECLRPRSPEELAKLPKLTREQIDDAIAAGDRAFKAAERAGLHGWRFR